MTLGILLKSTHLKIPITYFSAAALAKLQNYKIYVQKAETKWLLLKKGCST